MSYNYDIPRAGKNEQFHSTGRLPQIRMGTKVSNSLLANANELQRGHPSSSSAGNIYSANNRRNIPIQVRYASNKQPSVLYLPKEDGILVQSRPNYLNTERQYFGDFRAKEGVPSYRSLANTYSDEISPPMSYNIRNTTLPESNQWPIPQGFPQDPPVVFHHHYQQDPPAAQNVNSSPRRFPGNLETLKEHVSTEVVHGRNESSAGVEHESDTVLNFYSGSMPTTADSSSLAAATAAAADSSHMTGGSSTQIVSETDIICSSSSEGEDDVVKGCADEVSQRTTLSYGGEFVAASSSDESEDPELLDLREREQIVEKYEKGPDSKDVDPWENPEFELYKVTDRFGFVHKSESELAAEEHKRRQLDRELKREHKWLRMIEEWKQRHPAKLPERIWKGIPDKLRLVFWKRLLDIEKLKSEAKPNLFNELLMRARLISKEVKQIDLDINRTYRDHMAFRKRYDVKQQSLFNVLAAYAMYNTEVGYCQGMSQIAAIFLMYMDEEDAFWCLHSLLSNRKYAMHGFFVPGFPKLARFQNHYEKVIQKYLPRVQKHLDKAGIPNIHLTKWWFGCFLDRVPFALAIRVWDVFLYYGDAILMAMAYNIMKMHKKTILKLQMEGFMDFIQQKLANDFGYTNDQTMESLEECWRRLQSDRMALPLPPNPDDQQDVPTKPLGPILTRSMIDIRMDIAEIHSRSSRANSLAGRSPALKRQHKKNFPAITDHNLQKTSQPSNDANIRSSTSTPMPNNSAADSSENAARAATRIASGSPADPTTPRTNSPANTGATNSEVPSLPAEAFSRIPSIKRQGGRPLKPPPVPDADGFVRMSPRHQSKEQQRVSYYDNVAPSSTQGGNGLTHGSMKARKENRNTAGPSATDPNDGDVDNISSANLEEPTRVHSSGRPREVRSAGKRAVGTGSLKQKTGGIGTGSIRGRDLSKVVELYHQQHKQELEHQQQISDLELKPFEAELKANALSANRQNPTITEEENKAVVEPRSESSVEKIVRRTPDNVTYVSVSNNAEPEDIRRTNSANPRVQQHRNTSSYLPVKAGNTTAVPPFRHMPAVPLPYCPPPDYNNDDEEYDGEREDEEYDTGNRFVAKNIGVRQPQISRSRNAETMGYGGSLHRSQQHQRHHSPFEYAQKHGEVPHIIPGEKLPDSPFYQQKPQSSAYSNLPRRQMERHPVSATISQPVGAPDFPYHNYHYAQRPGVGGPLQGGIIPDSLTNYQNTGDAGGMRPDEYWNTAGDRYRTNQWNQQQAAQVNSRGMTYGENQWNPNMSRYQPPPPGIQQRAPLAPNATLPNNVYGRPNGPGGGSAVDGGASVTVRRF